MLTPFLLTLWLLQPAPPVDRHQALAQHLETHVRACTPYRSFLAWGSLARGVFLTTHEDVIGVEGDAVIVECYVGAWYEVAVHEHLRGSTATLVGAHGPERGPLVASRKLEVER